MIRICVIDDEPLARMLVKEFLQDHASFECLAECNDGFEGVKAIQQYQPDLIFLDIQMPRINGFEMLELLEHPPDVIFTTAFDEYAIKAFELHAVDYLLKPFSKERFDMAIEKYLSQKKVKEQKLNTQALIRNAILPVQSDRIVVKNGGQIRIIPVSDIHYLEAADDYVKIHTKDGIFLKNKTMSFFENALPAALFARTHRSYILNVQEITRIVPYEKENHLAILKSGAKIPVSKGGYGKLREVLGL